MLSQFRPALRFLVVFLATYFVGNIIYGLYVEFFRPLPDPVTVWVTTQAAQALSLSGMLTTATSSSTEPIVWLKDESKTVLGVFEGCNGISVGIVFFSFLVAFGGKARRMIIFALGGFIVLHVANLFRIILLYYTARNRPFVFYYFHKYLFTAVLYLVVFALWFLWTRMKVSGNGHAEE